MDNFTSWANLGTLAGATAVTLLVIQYIKPLLPKIDTRIMVLVLAVVLTQAAAFVAGASVQEHIISVLNAFIVASSAMGSYELTFKKSDEAKKLGDAE